ncbi:hypothetical protein D3C72_1352720 [compost metagenome]
MQRQHRHADLRGGLRNPAQAVAAQPVGVGHRLHAEDRRVDGLLLGRQRGIVIELEGQAGSVHHVLRQHAVDRTVLAEGAPDRVLQALGGGAAAEADGEHRPLAAGQVLDDLAQFLALARVGDGVGGEQRRLYRRHDLRPVAHGPGRGRHVGQQLGGGLVAAEVVEQFGVAYHAAHRHRPVVRDLVVGRGDGLGFHGRRADMAAHRMADDVHARRCGQRAAVLFGDVDEGQRERVRVFHACPHVIVIR